MNIRISTKQSGLSITTPPIGTMVRSGFRRVLQASTDIIGWAGGGSGLWEGTSLTSSQKSRPNSLQDTRRSFDSLTWRNNMSYGRQLYVNCGEVRGPIIERALLANSGGWEPRAVGKKTDKKVRDQYEEWLWNWMQQCDLRGPPYDFWSNLYVASIALDRDGEPPVLLTADEAGNPRLQWIAPHRIYAPTGLGIVPDGHYKGRSISNGVIFDQYSRPIAYRVLDESIVYANTLLYHDIPASSLFVTYRPEWCDSGRGVTALAHAIKAIFTFNDAQAYMLIGLSRDARMPLIEYNDTGSIDIAHDAIHGGDKDDEEFTNARGDPIFWEDLDEGSMRYFRANSGQKLEAPASERPNPNGPAFMETVLRGVYQGLPWDFIYTRSTKEAGGADLRGVTLEKINGFVLDQFQHLDRIAKKTCRYALAVAVARDELPPGEWWALEFPTPPKLSADRWRQYQEERENLKLGVDLMRNICQRNGLGHWRDDVRAQADEEADDLFTRCETHATKHKWLKPREVLDILSQRSPNPTAAPVPTQEKSGDIKPTANSMGK